MLRSDANKVAAIAVQDAYAGLSAVLERLRAVQSLVHGSDAHALAYALEYVCRARTHVEFMRVLETTNTDWGV